MADEWMPRVFASPLDCNSSDLRRQGRYLLAEWLKLEEGNDPEGTGIPFRYPNEEPVPEGHFRCFLCRRVEKLTSTLAEMLAQFLARHGEHGVFDKRMITCDDCNTVILMETGMSL